MNFDFKYYRSILWRRFPYFLVVAALFTSLGLIVAMILPPEYEAQATLLVESPQIPAEMASSTVQTSAREQLQIIEQRLMTRANLIDTANRLNVYGGEPPSASQIVADMRNRTNITSGSPRDTTTIIQISFRAPRSELAAEVANEFVTLVLRENVEMRTNRAGDTLDFFQQEADRLGAELDAQSSRILDFQTENAGALPSGEEFLRQQRTAAETRLAQINRDLTGLRDQRDRLVEIYERTGGSGEQQARNPDEQALFDAQRELEEARLVYSDDNPRIEFLRSRVALLQERVAANIAAGSDNLEEANTPAALLLNEQLSQIDSQVQALTDEQAILNQSLEEVSERLSRIPGNAVTLDKLQRDYQNVQDQYNRAVTRLAQAQTGERIELLSKGERISVVEQATAPENPTKPNRPMIAAAGAGVGVAAGFALIFLLELLNRSVRRPVELTDRLGITPIGVLPYIRTERELVTKRMVILLVLALLLVVIPAVLFYVHNVVTPLDHLIEPLANKLGFSITAN